jgi:hypothetical protein
MSSTIVKPALREVLIFITPFFPFFHGANFATSMLFVNFSLTYLSPAAIALRLNQQPQYYESLVRMHGMDCPSQLLPCQDQKGLKQELQAF